MSVSDCESLCVCVGPSNPTLTQGGAPRPCGGVVAGTAISYDKGKQFPWEADTSNDSIIAFITVGASPLESTVGNKCLMSRAEEGDGLGGWPPLRWILTFSVCQNAPAGPIVNIVET